ncbi:PD-(D/E)XK nuclease domain-containing protein [Candidatus Cardinium hertigii]|uniref:PD-(D/E)XK nuclease domain-containing protein n=1 Tax=Candidatus Cardinium hertigii TaxID=247481 RepID=UPI003D7F17ED
MSRKLDNEETNNNLASSKKKEPVVILVEIKSKEGAIKAIEQIDRNGYIYNLPNIRTNRKDAVIIGVDFNKDGKNGQTVDNTNDQKVTDIKVETRLIDTFERNLVADLVDNIDKNKSKDEIRVNIAKQIKHLYYSSIKSKDYHFLRNLLLGQSITLNPDLIDNRYVFKYELESISQKVTTILLHKKNKELGIILNIVESNGEHSTRSKISYDPKSMNLDKDKIVPIDSNLSIKNLHVVTIKVKPSAKYFSEEVDKGDSPENYYLTSESIQIETNKKTSRRNGNSYKGEFKKIGSFEINELIKSIYGDSNSSGSKSDRPPSPKRSKPNNFQTILLDVLKPLESFIKSEADLQHIIHGMLIDQTLKDGERIKVFSEVTSGNGRADIVFLTINNDAQETRYAIIELKYKGNTNNQVINGNKQIEGYNKFSKLVTDLPESKGVTIVFNSNRKNADLVTVSFSSHAIDHSSQEDELSSSEENMEGRKRKIPNKNILEPCLGSNSRRKRETECKIGWDDVDKISSSQTRNPEEIEIDAKKFLEYSKQHEKDDEKSSQLSSLAEEIQGKGEGKIVGKPEYKKLLDTVVKYKSYKNYIQQKRINDIGRHIIYKDEFSLSLKWELVNAAGKLQLMHGVYGTIISCENPENIKNCVLSTASLGYSFLSQPIENRALSIAYKTVDRFFFNNDLIQSKMLPYKLEMMQEIGIQYAPSMAKVGAGVFIGIFDIIDIGISISSLIECRNRAASDNRCSDKEIRDTIAMIGFSSISFASGIGLTVMEAGGPVGVVVGMSILAGQGIYNGISNVIAYEKRYHTTLGEDWSILWRSILSKNMAEDIEHLVARNELINDITQTAWKIFSNKSSDVVAYAIGIGKEQAKYFLKCEERLAFAPGGPYSYKECNNHTNYITESSYSRIDLSKKSNTNHTLSRVQPKSIANVTMICLPKVTGNDYEKGIVQSNADAVYECDNAVVMAYKQREYSDTRNKSKYIIYDLNLVNAGYVVASNEHNNIFDIFGGNTEISGGKSLNNIFNIRNNTYHGKINLGSGSTNVIDVRNPSNSTISIEYLYERGITQMNITTNSSMAHISATLPIEKIQYVSDSNKVDKIVCKDSNSTTYDDNIAHNHITIDSGGGPNNSEKDSIIGCRNVILSPNTIVTGDNGNYTIYIKCKNFNTNYAESNINLPVNSQKTIIFPNISLLKDATSIKYNASRNGLTINIPLSQNGQYVLELENYLTNTNRTSYVFIDKHGSNIVPRLDNVIESHDVNHFLIYADIRSNLEEQTLIKHYQNITYTTHKYNIFSILRNKNNDLWQFGSVGNDIIQNDGNTIFMSGGEGSDLYVITQTKKYLDLSIRNHAKDLAIDILSIPSILTDIILSRNGNHLVLDLLFSNYITLLDYFINKENQHIALIDQNNDTFMPLAIEDEITLIPFLRKHLSKNIFRCFSSEKHIAIDIEDKDILLYQQENDLFITEQTADNIDGLNIILTDYYANNEEWLDVKFYAYKNAVISTIDLHHMATSYMPYEKPHDSVIQTYAVDLTNGFNYVATTKYNHTPYYSNALRQYNLILSDKKLTVLLFKDTPLKRLVVENYTVDTFVYKDNLYKDNMLQLHDWTDRKDKILIFEFDNGLEPDRIYLSNTTIARIKLNNEIDKKIDGNITVQLIEGLMSHCMPSNAENVFPNHNQLGYSFLEAELHYRNRGSIDTNNGIGERSAAEVLIYLAFKSYNELLLKYPDIEKAYLRKIDDSCFGTLLPETCIKMIIDRVNMTSSLSGIEQFINDNQKDINSLAVKELLDLAHPHKHRHHHGESAGAHHRGRRDVPSSASRLESVPISIVKNIWSKMIGFFSFNYPAKMTHTVSDTYLHTSISGTHVRLDLGNTALQYNHTVPNSKYGYSNQKYNTQNQYIKCVPYIWNAINQEYTRDGMTCTFSHGQAQIFSNIHQGTNAIQDKGYSIGGDNYNVKNCHRVNYNDRPFMHCTGKHTTIIYTPYNIPPIDRLEDITSKSYATLCLFRVLHINQLGLLIWKAVTNPKVLFSSESSDKMVEITPEQKNEWQDSIKKIASLIQKLEKLSFKLSKEDIKFNSKVIKNNLQHAKLDLQEHIKEIEILSKKYSTEYKTISMLNEQLEWLPKDLKYDIDALNDQQQKVQQVDGKQPNARYSYDHLWHSISALDVGDNIEYCSNINQNHVNEQNPISMGNMTNTESVKIFNTWEGYQKVV